MSYRRNGPIEPTSGNDIPTNLLFFDTETYVNKDTQGTTHFDFRLAMASHLWLDAEYRPMHNDILECYSVDDLRHFIYKYLSTKHTLYVFALNIGFDLRTANLFIDLHNDGFISNPPLINERMFIWKVRKGKYRIFFVDIANYAVQSLRSLGESLGFTKLTIPDFNIPDDQLFEYCLRDVKITEKFILDYIEFIRTNDLGSFKLTLASQALTSWRHRLMTKKVYLHSNTIATKLERESYHGGRVECYRLGVLPDEEYYDLDINSMYPFIMASYPMPIRFDNYTRDPSIDNLRRRVNTSYTIARVKLQTDNPAYPYTIQGRLCFPTGIFHSVLHQSELLFALQNNHIKSVIETCTYSQDVIFSDYVNFYYPIKIASKLSGNKSWEFISKIFLNALYGKFAQVDTKVTLLDNLDNDAIWRLPYFNRQKGIKGQVIAWNRKLYDERKSGETAYSFPAVAGAITAYARMLLYSYQLRSGDGNTLYCDTDSLICNLSGYRNLQHDLSATDLGKLKLVKQSNYLVIRGCKDYTIGDETRIKGKSANAVDISENSWRQLQFESVLAWINRGGKGVPLGHDVVKHRSGNYSKGVVHNDGTITPYVLINDMLTS